MAEYIERKSALKVVEKYGLTNGFVLGKHTGLAVCIASEIVDIPAADVAPVVRCKGCKHSTLPSELTQRYGKPGTLTCHNRRAPCNRRNVGSNDFCSYGEPKEGAHADDHDQSQRPRR